MSEGADTLKGTHGLENTFKGVKRVEITTPANGTHILLHSREDPVTWSSMNRASAPMPMARASRVDPKTERAAQLNVVLHTSRNVLNNRQLGFNSGDRTRRLGNVGGVSALYPLHSPKCKHRCDHTTIHVEQYLD
eukprot:5607292-Amphidinium_carterae.2